MLVDGSGLSPLGPACPPVTARAVLATAADVGRATRSCAPVLTGLPVAGFTGTLADRFDAAGAQAAAGVVRAKTGTLHRRRRLAGTVRRRRRPDRSPSPSLADRPARGHDASRRASALDRAAAASPGCGCG